MYPGDRFGPEKAMAKNFEWVGRVWTYCTLPKTAQGLLDCYTEVVGAKKPTNEQTLV